LRSWVALEARLARLDSADMAPFDRWRGASFARKRETKPELPRSAGV